MMHYGPTTILLSGVGGQGVILAGDVLADAAFRSGLDVKKSEVHGLSRRFGSVVCQVRFGTPSPLCGHRGADVLLALEVREGLRQLPYLHGTGAALVNRLRIGPSVEQLTVEPRVSWVDGSARVRALGHPAGVNLFMLGVLAGWLPMIDEAWRDAIRGLFPPRFVSTNLALFAAGQRYNAETNAALSPVEVTS
jgi:indolepyruvate ferredoxin oxidoreductase beta subunit